MIRKWLVLTLLGFGLVLSGCSSGKSVRTSGKGMPTHNSKGESLAGFAGKGSNYYHGKGKIPRGGGKYHVGKPYQIAGKWYHPKAQPGYDKKGNASWYGEAFHRRKTANGEYFDMNMLTAAHPTLPLPSYARVTNLDNGKVIVVRINDRGPFVGTRLIDLSKRSADALAFRNKGKARVRVQWIGDAPVNDKGGHLAMMNRKAAEGSSLRTLIAAADGKAGPSDAVQVASADDTDMPAVQPPKRVVEKQRVAKCPSIIQIGSFRSRDGAEQARATLSAIGPVQVYEWDSAEGPLYKVQMGPFNSRVGASDALNAVQAEGYDKARLEAATIEQVAYNQ